MARYASRLGGQVVDRPDGHDLAAADPRPGPEVDDVVGRPHGLFVVLDHHDRVALVAQLGQGVQQPIVVAGVQADRRLVEDIQHADQPAADLPGQPNPLHLTAGQRGRGPGEREIIEPDILQEPQPAADLLQRLGGHDLARLVEHQRLKEFLGIGHRQVAHLGQGALRLVCKLRRGGRKRYGPGLRVQPLAMAMGTADHAHVLLELSPLGSALGASVLREELGDDAFELAAPFVTGRPAPPGERDVGVARTVKQSVLQLRVEFFPGAFQHGPRLVAMLAFEQLGHAAIDVPLPTPHLPPTPDQFDATLLERLARVGDQQLGVEAVDFAQPVALRTHASRAIEAEQLRAGRLEAELAVRARIMGRKVDVFGILFQRHDQVAVAQFQGQLDRLGQTRSGLLAGGEPIDDHFDVVPHLAVQAQVVTQTDHCAVDPGAHEALFQQVLEQVAIFALLTADQGGQDGKLRAARQSVDPLENLLSGLGRDGPIALGTMPRAHPGIEHPQIIVNLGDRADGRARALAGGLLRDGDRGADAGDQVDVRLGHLAEKLAGETR